MPNATIKNKMEKKMNNIYPYISTWNVHGKGSPVEVDRILSHSPKIKLEDKTPHIVCVQEANLPSSSEELKYFRWLCSGKFGSAVLINKDSTLKARSFEQVCEQICVAEVVTDDAMVIKVISCYIPPSTDYATKDLWPKLVEVIKTIPVTMKYVLAGDFNAEIGKDLECPSRIKRGIIGPKLHHETSNENGMLLIKLAFSIHATIASTFGNYDSKEPSYTYHDGKEKSQRSFIILPSGQTPYYPCKILLQECKFSWYPNYKSAVLSRSLRFAPDEKFLSKLTSSPVIVSSWNVQGASPSAVDKALSELDLPIACVQELFIVSENAVETNNYTWFTSKKLWGKNVGILIKSCPEITMGEFDVVSECLCVGSITVKGSVIKVICCSMPPYTDSVRFQETTARLMELVKNIPEETDFVVAGDFNTNATYTLLDDTLLFDKGDDNALVLQKLMKECNMELPYVHKNSVTQISEKVRRNSSFIFMSSSCLMKYAHKLLVSWIPFFENGVITLYLPNSDVVPDRFVWPLPKNETSVEKQWTPEKEELVNGFIYVTRKYCRMKRYLKIGTTEPAAYRFLPSAAVAKLKNHEKSDLPDEILNKYKNSPPPVDELLRILGDGFTLYYGFLQESMVLKGCLSVLAASFECLNRGALLAECIDVFEEKTKEPVKRIVKFLWNGIVVHQQEGGKFINYKRIINKGQKVLIGILGQHYFTVKARGGFYNNGLPPLCENYEKLKEVMRVLNRSNIPGRKAAMENVKSYINKFASGNPHYELVFGPTFSFQKFLEPIKKYAGSKNLGVRTYKSSKDLEHYDHVSVFVQHKPQKLRDLLMKYPEHRDLRYQLIPPCGTDNDYFDWIAQWEEKVIPDEYYKPYEKIIVTPEPQVASHAEVAPCNGSSEEHNQPANLEEESETQMKKRSVGFVEQTVRNVGNQVQHRLVKCYNVISGNPTVLMPKGKKDWVNVARNQTDLPKEAVDKYCETPPPAKDLSRFLGDDFTLYYGFGRSSSVVSNNMEILAESFESTNRGGVMYENIEVIKNGKPDKRLVKYKWNGICIHEEEGSMKESFKNIGLKGLAALINKLGQNHYAVRAKMSYFNEGSLPRGLDQEKLSEVLRMVKKSDFPTTVQLGDIKNFISEFFSKDSDVELVFGPEFSLTEFLEPIRRFAMDKELGYRLIKSAENVTSWDTLGIFTKRSPLSVRDRLMMIPDHQDLRFFLIPPCEFFNKSHYEWILSWTAENFAEEFKLIMEKENNKPKRPAAPKKKETPKPPPAAQRNQKTKQKPAPQKQSRQQIDSHRGRSRPNPIRSAAQNKRSRQQEDYYRDNSRTQLPRSAAQIQRSRQQEDYYRDNSRTQLPRLSGQDQSLRQPEDYYEDYHRSIATGSQIPRSDGYDTSNWRRYQEDRSELAGRKRDWELMDYYEENSMAQATDRPDDIYVSNLTRSEGHIQEPDDYGMSNWSSRQGDRSEPDDYGMSNWSSRQGDRSEPAGRKRVWEQMDYYGEQPQPQSSRSDDYRSSTQLTNQARAQDPDDYGMSNWSSRQGDKPEPERYVPESKRSRQQPLPIVDTPRWDDVGPLIIVWPVNIRSGEEKDPRKVLEANFPTEISLESNNRVAVYVTLPVRNRRDKKYCLCVGTSVNNATRTALDMIVKRSSIIKYTVNFLPPDGLVPNFIRYNVPCQTNPRTYITLNWRDTGPLTEKKINDLLNSFKCSLNEDLFFDKEYYSHEMKLMLLELAPKYGLKVRHFGTDHKLMDRYVCVYKTKPKDEVLEEVLKMRDMHPKYRLVTNKLPPRLGLNIF